MDASGVRLCGFGGDGVFRGALVAGLCTEQDVQPLWMVSDWFGVGVVVGKIELIGADWAKACELVGFFKSGEIRRWSRYGGVALTADDVAVMVIGLFGKIKWFFFGRDSLEEACLA